MNVLATAVVEVRASRNAACRLQRSVLAMYRTLLAEIWQPSRKQIAN